MTIREIGHDSPIGRLNERPEPYEVRRSFQEQRFDSIFSVPKNHHNHDHHHHDRPHRYDYEQRPLSYYQPQSPSFKQVAGGVLKGAAAGAAVGSVIPIIGPVVGGLVGGIAGGLKKLFG